MSPFFSTGQSAGNQLLRDIHPLACIGLIGRRIRKPLFWRGVRVLLAVRAWGILVLLGIGSTGVALHKPAGPKDHALGLLAIGFLPLFAALCRGLHHYAFRSRPLWP